MRLPYSWLREVVQAGAPGWDVAPHELEQALIRIGHEVEDVIPLGPVSGPLVIGRVTAIEELTATSSVGQRTSVRATWSWSPFRAPSCPVASTSPPARPTAGFPTA